MSNLTPIDTEYLVFSDPKLISKVTRHISNGGSLIDLAPALKVDYCDLIGWLRSDKQRSLAYDQSIEDRKEWARETILKDLRALAGFDIRLLLSPDGGVLPVDQWPADSARAIAGMDIFEEYAGSGQERELVGHVKKFKTVDKLRAIELLMKNLAMLTEKHEVSGHVTLDQLILATQHPNNGNK